MKIKRTFAKNIREAMKKVREEQGPDAVILANKKVEGGVEIVSAVDYDEEVVYQQAHQQELEEKKVAVVPKRTVTSSYKKVLQSLRKPVQSQAQVKPSVKPKPAVAAPKPVVIRSNASRAAAYNQHDMDAALNKPTLVQPKKAKPVVHKEVKPVAHKVAKPVTHEVAKPVTHEVAKPFTHEVAKVEPTLQQRQRAAQAQIAAQRKAASKGMTDDMVMMKDIKQELSFLRDMMESQMNILEWDKVAKRHPIRVALLNELIELGLGNDVAQKIVDAVPETKDLMRARRLSLGIMAKMIPVSDDDIINFGGVIAVIGATGVGKTTTIAKLAAQFAMKHGNKQVVLVTTDSYRIGAHEQLSNYSRILGVPLHIAQDSDDLTRILASLMDKRLVLIDTAGMSQRDLRLTEQFNKLQKASVMIRPYLVLSANTQLESLNETVKVFNNVDIAGCIITKLDEATTLGGVITAVIKSNIPVAYLTDGQKVPEDIQQASAQRLISRAVPLGHKNGEMLATDTMGMQFLNMNRQSNG